jgi:hypothetical protein
MRAKRMKARGRNQERNLLDQLRRLQQQVRGAVRPRMGQLEQQRPVRALRQPLPRRRRAQERAAQMLQPRSRVRRHGQDDYERRYQSRVVSNLTRRARELSYTLVKTEDLTAASLPA